MDYETKAYLRKLTKCIEKPRFTLYFRNQKVKVLIDEDGELRMTRKAFEACVNDNALDVHFGVDSDLQNAPDGCHLRVSAWMESVTHALYSDATVASQVKAELAEIRRDLSGRIAVCLREYLRVKLSQKFDAQITKITNKKRKLDEMLSTNVVRDSVVFENLRE